MAPLAIALCAGGFLLAGAWAFALAPLQTLQKPTTRVWREDLFDRDLIQSNNLCAGAQHEWYYDPAWTLYKSPTGNGTIAAITTTDVAPSTNDELEFNPAGLDTLMMGFVDTTAQLPAWAASKDQGMFAKVTLGELGVYHARFEVMDNITNVRLAASAWPIGAAERDSWPQAPLEMVFYLEAAAPVLAGFGGVGYSEAAGAGSCLFDDLVFYEFGAQSAYPSPITKTLFGFQGGGHFFAQCGNGNPDCPAGAGGWDDRPGLQRLAQPRAARRRVADS